MSADEEGITEYTKSPVSLAIQGIFQVTDMRKLSKAQFQKMDGWMQENARPYDRAKWNHLFHDTPKETIVTELLRYQNPDGGMGNGYESDVLLPLSAAIPTAEAIFQTYDYGLDTRADWFRKILSYFENTVQAIPKYWEDCPKEAMDYPHAPWWNWAPCMVFNPNPCGCIASALIRYGTDSQKELGYRVAGDCLTLLVSGNFCGDHDSLNIKALVEQLYAMDSPLITEDVMAAMGRRILENTCFDSSQWHEYTFQPLDFVDKPDSLWINLVKDGIEENVTYWLDTLNADGVWEPNFSWGVNSDVSRQVTQNWRGYIAVKRARILLNFGWMEIE